MMPHVDLPDVLLESFARTGVVDCFTHVFGAIRHRLNTEPRFGKPVAVCGLIQ